MSGRIALDHALELTHSPHLAAAMREQELPDDVIVPIRIAAGCSETCGLAVELTKLRPEMVQEIARTYLQLVLFSSEGDCFRTLGVRRGASQTQMREHMRWLLQWLHPDRNSGDWESVYAERVIRAWRDAKTLSAEAPETHQVIPVNSESSRKAFHQRGGRTRAPLRWVPLPVDPAPERLGRPLRIGAIVLLLGLTLLAVPHVEPFAGWINGSRSAKTIGQ
jgi:hypothetical protein